MMRRPVTPVILATTWSSAQESSRSAPSYVEIARPSDPYPRPPSIQRSGAFYRRRSSLIAKARATIAAARQDCSIYYNPYVTEWNTLVLGASFYEAIARDWSTICIGMKAFGLVYQRMKSKIGDGAPLLRNRSPASALRPRRAAFSRPRFRRSKMSNAMGRNRLKELCRPAPARFGA